jgi:protein subunit release factor A
MKILMELRAGEGGADAKMLVHELANVYVRFAESINASVVLEDRGSL